MTTFAIYLDTGFTVEAPTEEEALAQAVEALKARLADGVCDAGDFIVDESWDDES